MSDTELRERIYYTLASTFQDGEAVARGRRSADGGPWKNRIEEFTDKLKKDFLANKNDAVLEEARKCKFPILHSDTLGNEYKPKPFVMPQNGCHLHPVYVVGCKRCKDRYPDYESPGKEK